MHKTLLKFYNRDLDTKGTNGPMNKGFGVEGGNT